MSPDLLAFLFLVTSTALVLGVAVIVRGMYGFVSDPSPRLPEGSMVIPRGTTRAHHLPSTSTARRAAAAAAPRRAAPCATCASR